MIDRRLLTHFDWQTFGITACLVAIGFSSVYSATHIQMPSVYKKEFYWIILGFMALFTMVFMNYSVLERFAYPIYAFSILLLIAVFFIGRTTAGAQRWIPLGPFSIQPSEFAKLSLVIVLAKYFSEKPLPGKGLGIKDLMPPALLMLLPFLLIAKQPDLGTGIILWMIFWSMVIIIRIRTRVLAGIFLTFAAMLPFGWKLLKDYQKARIMSFVDPGSDPLGSGYHVLQSKIAIGSGGVMGKGFTQGTQGKLMFLPEHHTDFVFSVLAEEWGLIGSMVLLGLFLAFIMNGLSAAKESKDRFGLLLALGISAMFMWHVTINMGMVSGILPVVGVPLPFISYGGSFMLTCMIGAGILINIRMRRFIF